MWKLASTLTLMISLILWASSASYAHRSGCHRWHSCPSDRGTYICGVTGHCSQCPDNQYCEEGNLIVYQATQPSISKSPPTIESSNTQSKPTGISFSKAKRKMMNIYLDHGQNETFYCGCSFDEDKDIDRSTCDYEPRKPSNKRSRRLEWEHVMPAATFGGNLQCWKERLCTNSKGKKFKGRKCCKKVSHDFKRMEGDMHNLFPAIGEVNGDRSNYRYGEVIGEPREYGQCDVEIQDKVAEPDENIRGEIARAYFYMSVQYKVPIPESYEDMLREWHFSDPPSQWEEERNTLIEQGQGNRNPFIDQPELVEEVGDF